MKTIKKVFLISCLTSLSVLSSRVRADSLVAYVSNSGDDTVSMISLDSLRAVDTIPVGHGPCAAALTPNGSRLYVANALSDSISVIDTLSHSVIATVPVGGAPSALAISADGTHVYVANSGSANVSVIGTASNLVETTFSAAPAPSCIAVHPLRNEIWVGFNLFGTVLAVFSGDDYSNLASLQSNSRRYASKGLQFRPDGSEVFGTEACGCCGQFDGISGVISNGSLTVIEAGLYNGGDFAIGVAVHPFNGTAFFAQQGNCASPPTPHISERGGANRVLPLAQIPQALAITPDGNQLCVVGTNCLMVFDTASFGSVTNITVGTAPNGVAVGRVNLSPTLTIAVSEVQLCWNSASNTQYQLEYQSALTTNIWLPLGGVITGNGMTICTNDSTLGEPARFYRVRLVQ